MTRPQTPADPTTPASTVINAERLAKYRVTGNPDSLIVQRGVIDRLLDQRLEHMGARDKTAARN